MSVRCLQAAEHFSTSPDTKLCPVIREPKSDTLAEKLSIFTKISIDELALLAKLEEANRRNELDAKSLNSLHINHSRKGSDTSQVSSASGGSNSGGDATGTRRHESTDDEEVRWNLWGEVVVDWESYWKKRKDFVKELVRQGIPHHFRYPATVPCRSPHCSSEVSWSLTRCFSAVREHYGDVTSRSDSPQRCF